MSVDRIAKLSASPQDWDLMLTWWDEAKEEEEEEQVSCYLRYAAEVLGEARQGDA